MSVTEIVSDFPVLLKNFKKQLYCVRALLDIDHLVPSISSYSLQMGICYVENDDVNNNEAENSIFQTYVNYYIAI